MSEPRLTSCFNHTELLQLDVWQDSWPLLDIRFMSVLLELESSDSYNEYNLKVIQPFLFDTINLHDSCGVNNLHGIPGVLGGLLSVLMCAIANEDVYGPALYVVLPNMAPENGTEKLAMLQSKLSIIEPGVGRTAQQQV